MRITEEERNELIELENTVALQMVEVSTIRNNMKDGVERRRMLAKLQISIGKNSIRLRELRKLV